MKKVLMIEDDDMIFQLVSRGLRGKVDLLWADTLEKGSSLFAANPDVEIIIMDACVPGSEINSVPLVEEIVATGYTKPIIASSSMPHYNRQLTDAGATHTAEKRELAKTVLSLLNL